MDPNGPVDTESGFNATVVQFAKYGREYVKIGLEQSPAKAWSHWRSTLRAHLHFGGERESELYEDYNQAVRAYMLRHEGRRTENGG